MTPKKRSLSHLLLVIAAVTLTVLAPRPAQAAGTLISAPARVDMVHDAARDILYITSGSSVLRYQLSTNTFLTPYTLSGNLLGLDLAPDGNTLIVADSTHSSTQLWVHVINLQTGVATKAYFPLDFGEGGTWTVAFGNDGAALISSRYEGSGWTPLRRYHPGTGATTVIGSEVRQDTMLTASADGSVIGFAESNSSDGPWGRYRVSDGNLVERSGYTDGTSWFNYEIGVNKDGSQFAIPTYGGTFIYDAAYQKIKTIGVYAGGQPIGVVYHPTQNIVYFPWVGTREIRAFDTSTWEQLATYDFEYTFQNNGNDAFNDGRMKISRDGTLLFATVGGGVRYYRLPKPGGPSITSFTPASGRTGTTVIIYGTNFTSATNVRFNGTPASFTIDSATRITATVPAGAGSGPIQVTNPIDSINSTTNFIVDNVDPSIAISKPAADATLYNELSAINGTCRDNNGGSGIARVDLFLTRPVGTTGNVEYWNGNAWVSASSPLTTVLTPTSGGFAWKRAAGLPTGFNLATGSYSILVRAWDAAGNTNAATRDFNVIADVSPPTVIITGPRNGGSITSLSAIRGTAADGTDPNSTSGVDRVKVLLYRANPFNETYEYWTGSSWGGRTWLATTLTEAATGWAWKRDTDLPTGGQLPPGTYYLKAQAFDLARNASQITFSSFQVTSTTAPSASTTAAHFSGYQRKTYNLAALVRSTAFSSTERFQPIK